MAKVPNSPAEVQRPTIKWVALPSPPGPLLLAKFLLSKLRDLSANVLGISIATCLAFGMGMIQIDEYLAAIGLWLMASVLFLIRAVHWKGVDNRPFLTLLGRFGWFCGSIIFFIFTYYYTEIKRGDKPWSILIVHKKSTEQPPKNTEPKPQEPAPIPKQSPTPPRELARKTLPKVEQKTEEPKPELAKAQPDVSIRVVKMPLLAILILNTSADKNVVREPRYEAAFWDLDLPEGNESLALWSPSVDWLRPDQMAGPFAPFHSSADNLVKEGHRIFGYITVTCPNCIHNKAYWVYTVYGGEGKYAQLPIGRYPIPALVVKNVIPMMRKETPELVLSGLGPLEWIPIANFP